MLPTLKHLTVYVEKANLKANKQTSETAGKDEKGHGGDLEGGAQPGPQGGRKYAKEPVGDIGAVSKGSQKRPVCFP